MVGVKQERLARVAADLARGHTHPALQRLANLTALFPDDLEIRAERAAVNRQIGNVAEAGRWGFLTESVSHDEIAAFERAFRLPSERLGALRLRGEPWDRLGPLAAERLRDLTSRAGQPLMAGSNRPGESVALGLGCGALLLAVLAVLGLAVVGFISLIR